MPEEKVNAEGMEEEIPTEKTPLEIAQEEANMFREVAARAQADMVNFKRRMEQQEKEYRQFAITSTLLSFLPVLDNMNRALAHLTEEQAVSDLGKGLVAVRDQFLSVLEGMGVRKVPVEVGTQLNPTYHEVVMQAPGAKDTILQIFEDGYMLHERVVRPAKVQVGSGE